MAKSGISLLIISISNHATIRSESPRARTASSPLGSQIAGIVDPLRFAPRIPPGTQKASIWMVFTPCLLLFRENFQQCAIRVKIAYFQ